MSIDVEEVIVADGEVLKAMRLLIPQLSSSAPRIEAGTLEDIVANPNSALFLARGDEASILGSLVLVTFKTPTAVRAWIEDVVVDEQARGRGVGEALVNAAIDRARRWNAKSVDLTSRPSREAANRLYQRLGFELRDSNLYRFSLDS
ncbi:MAG: GNAT family N-acetyltransferase [Actinomycetota bacterium]|jgi:ribosomal protein S18 acetylase RimI-like enzyme